MYALIEIAGKQYKVEDGVSIKVPKLEGKIGAKYPIDKVLYIEENGKKIVGMPFVDGKKLEGEIVSHERGRKIVVFKFKRRKGYQTKNTHREEYTILKFKDVKTATKKTATKKTATKKTATKKTATKKTATKKTAETNK